MPTLLLDKPYTEEAEGLMRFVKDAVRTEQTANNGAQEIVIEGDFNPFIMHLMDTWGGHMRFVIRDTAPSEDEASRRALADLLMAMHEMAHQLTAKAQMRVYRRQIITTETIKRAGRHELSRETHDEEEWEDVTTEFGKISQREWLGGW